MCHLFRTFVTWTGEDSLRRPPPMPNSALCHNQTHPKRQVDRTCAAILCRQLYQRLFSHCLCDAVDRDCRLANKSQCSTDRPFLYPFIKLRIERSLQFRIDTGNIIQLVYHSCASCIGDAMQVRQLTRLYLRAGIWNCCFFTRIVWTAHMLPFGCG